MKRLAVILLFVVIGVQNVLAQVKTTAQGNIFTVSDIHLNPYYDPSLMPRLMASPYQQWPGIFASSTLTTQPNTYNADSNFPLFISALKAMKAQNPSPSFIIVTGDFLCHSFQTNFYNNAGPSGNDSTLVSFTSKTIQVMAMMFNQYFPNTVVLPVLGNNDSYCGDYTVAPNGPFLAMFAKAWVPLQRNHSPVMDNAFVTKFSKGGYYTYALKDGSGGTMVMLNTIFFSPKYTNCGVQTPDPAIAEMAWLTGTMQACKQKNSKMWLAMHIPPGIDVNGTLSKGYTVTMWDTSYNKQFVSLLTKYSANVTAGFTGHTHMDDFRIVYNTAGTPISFFHITPAISPLFNNNPGFQVLSYSKSLFRVTDMKTYFLNVSSTNIPWALEYDYDSTYGITSFTPASLAMVRDKMKVAGPAQAAYIKFYTVSSALSGIGPNFQSYWCGTGNLTPASFAACKSSN